MKKILWLLILVGLYASTSAQTYSNKVTVSDARTQATVKGGLIVQGSFLPPQLDTSAYIASTYGEVIIRPADGQMYISTGLLLSWQQHWKAVGSVGSAIWGAIGGNISAQADLQTEFNTKQNVLPPGTASQYWGADGSLQSFPTIPAQVVLTSPNGSIGIAGTYPNVTLQSTITRLGQLTNDVGFITGNQNIAISGDASGSGGTSIGLTLASIVGAGSCVNCSITFDAKGRATAFTTGSVSTPVPSVFGRTGAIVATTGDYTAAQITNALSALGSYTNPSWLVSIPWTKVTGTPTTIATYGITDNLVNTFNTRSGAVTLSSADVTTALTYTPVTNARTLTINGTTFDLTANRTWTITGTGTLNRISPIDSLGATANGLQISGQNLVPSTATATTAGMLDANHWKTLDSIYLRTIVNRIVLAHAGAGQWTAYSSPKGDSLYSDNIASGNTWLQIVAGVDSSRNFIIDSGGIHTYFNNYYLPSTATLTVNGTPYSLNTNPSITISGGGTTDTAKLVAGVPTAGLMSGYVYAKTLHPLIVYNDSTGLTRDSVFHSNNDTLFAKDFVFGYGLTSNWTQTTNYHRIDTSAISTKANAQMLYDILNAGKQPLMSGTGVPVFSGTSISYQSLSAFTASLTPFGTTTPGIVPAPGTMSPATLFLSGTGWTSLPAYSIFTGNGTNSGSSTDSIYWGGILNQLTTITNNFQNNLVFNGTYTTTANATNYWQINPLVTGRATASDANSGLLITGTYTPGANNQSYYALDLNPVLGSSSFTGGKVYSARFWDDVIPGADNSVNIGSTTNAFQNIYSYNFKSNGPMAIGVPTSSVLTLNGWGGTSSLTLGLTGGSITGSFAISQALTIGSVQTGANTDNLLTLHSGQVSQMSISAMMATVPYVTSAFGRNGVVTAQTGDYTAAQITNAVSTIGSYADPSWLTSLSYSKLTGAPAITPGGFTSWQQITAGGSQTVSSNYTVITPISTLSTLTLSLPTSPVNGELHTITCGPNGSTFTPGAALVTTFSLSGGSNNVIWNGNAAPTTLKVGNKIIAQYNTPLLTWYVTLQ